MKKIFLLIAISGLVGIWNLSAQTAEKGFDVSLLLGVNLGATTPVPVPDAITITGYQPKFNPKFGAHFAYYFNKNWGIGTGLVMEWKAMNVRMKVYEVHLSIDVPNLGTLTGYVTGRNKTQVNSLYLVQPIYGSYRFNNPKWEVKAGIYLAETLSRKFKGSVHDVEITVETPIQQTREIPYATLDYSNNVRKFDVGLLVGSEFRMNKHVGFFADFTWGFNPYFSSEVPIHFVMRNVYFAVGAKFRMK